MKTAEQMTADVLARRDEHLEKRALRRKQAKRYAAASLLVCAAAFAAAGLFRSGLLDDAPPVSLNDVTQSDRTDASESASSHGNDHGLPEGGTGARETTVPRAVDHTGTTTAIDLFGKTVYVFPSVTQAPSAAPSEEPGTAAQPTEPTTHRQPPETTTPQTPVSTTDPFGKILPCPTRPQPTTGNGSAGTEAPTALPTEEPETEDPTAALPLEEYNNFLYVVDSVSVYAAENAAPAAGPAGAELLEQKDGYAVGFDAGDSMLLSREEASFLVIADAELAASVFVSESSAGAAPPSDEPEAEAPVGSETEPPSGPEEAWPPPEAEKIKITLLALPGASAGARIGVTSEGFDGMFVLTYVCPLEELLQEETP